jgi:hypothetical protein
MVLYMIQVKKHIYMTHIDKKILEGHDFVFHRIWSSNCGETQKSKQKN